MFIENLLNFIIKGFSVLSEQIIYSMCWKLLLRIISIEEYVLFTIYSIFDFPSIIFCSMNL